MFIGAFNAGRRDIAVEEQKVQIRSDGTVAKIVEQVDAVTFSGRRAVARGQRVRYITERCVMELTPNGLRITEVAPGIDLERDVLKQISFEIEVAPDLKLMDPQLFSPEPRAASLEMVS